MQMSNKAKTPTSANVEVSIINPTTKGTNIMNNNISILNKSQLTMSSREIAELTNKEHRNVKRDIKNMFEQLGIGVLNFEQTYLDVQNKQQIEYLLPKKYIECLLTGYSIPLRMKVIDRMHELEEANKQTQSKLPTTKELALMVIQAEEENERLLIENKTLGSQLEEMKPTVEAFDRIATKAEGSMCVTDTAKHLQMQPRKFFQELNARRWIYKRTGCSHWLGYQDKVKQGLLEHKVTTVSRSDGSEKIVEQVLVTPKGLAKLSQILTMH